MTDNPNGMAAGVKGVARKIWLAALGAVAAVDEGGSRAFHGLIKRGEAFEKRNRPRVKETWDRVGGRFDHKVAGVLQRMDVPSGEDLKSLSRRIEQLSDSVDRLQTRRAAVQAEASPPPGVASPKPDPEPEEPSSGSS
jgi:hypothetical protein